MHILASLNDLSGAWDEIAPEVSHGQLHRTASAGATQYVEARHHRY
jgi:hypothetical protein